MNSCDQLPQQFLERLREVYDDVIYHTILTSFSNKPLPTFRANTLKISAEQLQDMLIKEGFQLEKISWFKDAFILHNKSIRELTETKEYQSGLIYIQNLSSMIPALVLDPQEGQIILDIAAAPGSKTTQIAALMNNTGQIVANDLSRKRLFKLKDNLSHMGVINTTTLNLPGESLWKRFPEYFDKTLVDVPCSMEGRIRCDDPKTYQDWFPRKIKQLSKLQKFILRSAISATKIGGTIIYSTCTLAPEENEEVIEWVLNKTAGSVTIEKIDNKDLPFVPGLDHWKKKIYQYGYNTGRIIPSEKLEGFFIAKLHKNASTLLQ